MEEEKESASVKSVSIKWGVIGGLVGIIFFLILDFTGLSFSPVRWAGLAVTFILIFLAHREFKSEGNGHMSYGQGLGIGTLFSVIASLIQSIFTFVYVSYINSNYVELTRENSIQQWEDQGMTAAQIEQATPIMETMTSPGMMLVFGIVFGVFIGFIISLIVSIFTKNPEPEFT